MKLYRLTFCADGQITRIPDAQTIFGALCAAIQMKDGQQKMEEYIHSLKTHPWFVHTSMFPKGLIPASAKPLLSLSELSSVVGSLSNGTKLSVLSDFKRLKKFQYMTESVFEHYILQGDFAGLKQKLLNSDQIRIQQSGSLSILQESKDNPSPFLARTIQQTRSGAIDIQKDKDLFYQKQMYLSESSELCVFVKSDLDPEQFCPYFKMLEYTGIGPYRSSGLNLFRLKKVEEYHFNLPQQEPYAFLLSGCIPEQGEFNFDQSFYKIETSSFRGSFSIVGNAFTGTFSKLKEGSLMNTSQKKDWYGQLIQVEFKGKKLYHYGLGVTI